MTFSRTLKAALGACSATLMVAAVPMVASAAPAPTVLKPGAECSGGENYFTDTEKWEINWGQQYTDQGVATYTSADYGGLTYIDPDSLKTPEEELAGIKAHDAKPTVTTRNAHYHWWYVSRDMVNNGATTVLKFKDDVTVVGEVAVGTDGCPSVKWTFTEVTTPDTFPAEPAPNPSPLGSLGSLGSLG